MKSILEWIANRAKEKSTWVGLFTLLTSAGVAIAPEYQETIISIGVALAGLAVTIIAEKGSEDKPMATNKVADQTVADVKITDVAPKAVNKLAGE